MKKPISKAKRTIVKSLDTEGPVRCMLELDGELLELFLAAKEATGLTSNTEVGRMALKPGLKSILQKFESENTAAA